MNNFLLFSLRRKFCTHWWLWEREPSEVWSSICSRIIFLLVGSMMGRSAFSTSRNPERKSSPNKPQASKESLRYIFFYINYIFYEILLKYKNEIFFIYFYFRWDLWNGQAIGTKYMWEIKTEPSPFGMRPKPPRFVKILLKKWVKTFKKNRCAQSPRIWYHPHAMVWEGSVDDNQRERKMHQGLNIFVKFWSWSCFGDLEIARRVERQESGKGGRKGNWN